MTATASHMAPKVARVMTRIDFMLARRPEIPPPPLDAHWFYLVIMLMILALVALVVLAADLLN